MRSNRGEVCGPFVALQSCQSRALPVLVPIANFAGMNLWVFRDQAERAR